MRAVAAMRSAEIASSKSRALAGSIVNVGSSRRSRRSGAARRATALARRAPRARPRRRSARARPRSSISASITSRATSGRPSTRTIARLPAAPRAAPDARRARCRRRGRVAAAARASATSDRAGARPRGPLAAGARPRTAARRSRKRPRRSSTAAIGGRARGFTATFGGERAQRHLQAVGRCRRRWRHGHFRGDAGALLDAAAAEVAPVGREVLADRDVERAAVGERLLLLEDALAEGVRADDGRAVVVLQRRRSRSPRPRRCCASTSTTTGIDGGIASPVARQRLASAGCARAW